MTCDSPTGHARRGRIAVLPVFSALVGAQQFSGLVVDAARITILRPPDDTVAQRTFPFSPDSSELDARLDVTVEGASEQFDATIELLAGGVPIFTGTQQITVVAGPLDAGAPPVEIPMAFVGPGRSIAALAITPATAGLVFGDSAQFLVSATDSLGQPVPDFYIAWSSSVAAHPINATGMLRAGAIRGALYVTARTPTGIEDSVRVFVAPVPNAVAANSGGGQSGVAGTDLAQPLVARVTAADAGPVAGVTVTFAAASGGGSVSPVTATTDSLGLASTTATLGPTAGSQSFSATVSGLTQATYSATAAPPGGVPVLLVRVAGNNQSATVNSSVAVAPRVRVVDAFGDSVPGVAVAFAVTSGGGAATGLADTTDASGQAEVGSWTLGANPGANTLRASLPGFPLVPAVSFTATGLAGPSIQLALAGNLVGVSQTAPLTVNLTQPAPAGGVTVSVTSDNAGTVSVAGPGAVSIAAGDSVGTIDVTGVAGGQTVLRASGTGYTSAQLTVTVTVNQLSVSVASVPVTQTGTVTVQASPAPASDLAVTVTSSDTTIMRVITPTVTILGGQTSISATVEGVAAGTANVMVVAAGYASGTNVVTVTGGTGITSTTVVPALDTLTALNETVTLTAEARDTAGTLVTGSYTWVSRTPGIATVTAAGQVAAAANGATWVVATEAGGSRDSARIVVEQRIASIAVSPAGRTIYLTRDYTFTAAAVDGLGSPMPGVTTFTWSSTAPAVATVDTSGFVTAVGIGSAQIRATSGAIIGVANVSVVTPITRIAVVVDTVGAAVSDTFTLTSLGLTRRYRAVAHDTLDAVMSGVSFAWASTNASVAAMNTTTGDTASVTSAANGLTQIRATAQGFMSNPGAVLTVAQVLAAIELTPPPANPTATIAIGGTLALTARGKDANSRYIAGGSFTFTSDTPAVATVNATSGVVTGVANGVSTVRAASGAITSSPLTVTVGGTVPAIISFGRDTLSVGRGSATSIPILLSRPNATDLVVNLAVADTIAYFSAASITIPAGATSANATLNGRNAGTTTVTANDGSGAGYSGAGAVLKVTANMNLQSGGYGINATDVVSTQVRLSDPSPAGGTYVTFSYGTAGIAAISPDPAFIPAGQLAADIQIRGLAAGTTSITPVATGVNGTASNFTAYAPVLTLSRSSLVLGQGQYDANTYVYTPTYTNVAVPVTLTSSDTSVIAVTPATATIPGGSYYSYFTISSRGTGTATVTASAAGWTSDALPVTVSTPRLGLSGGGSLFITSPQQNVTVYAEDSTQTSHYRTSSLAVRLTSRDTTVIRVLDTLVTIGPGQYYTSSGRVIPGGTGGTAWVVATAGGHTPDSVLYSVQGPPLSFSWNTNRIGAGQEDYNLYVYTPNNVTAPLVVRIANPDSSILGLADSVVIPTGTYYVYFTVRGKVPGSVTLTATAPGYQSDVATYVVTSPRIVISGGGTLNNFAPSQAYTVYATDSVGSSHYRTTPLTVSLASTDTTVLRTDTIATIAAGAYYTSAPTRAPVSVGTARIVATAAGHVPDSAAYTVVQPKLNLSFGSYRIGRRQHRNSTDFYVYTPNNRPVSVPVTLTQTAAAVESLTTLTPTIPANSYYAYFTLFGLTQGVDTIIATAAGYSPDTAYVTVTTPRFTAGGLPGSITTTNPPFNATVYATDSVGSAHYVSDTVVVAAVSSDTTVIRPVQPYFRIPRDAYYATTSVNVIGPGSASITFSDSAGTGYLPVTTNTVTVTGPSLTIYNGAPVLGMRQRDGGNSRYVYTPNPVAANLVVNLVSTDTRVAMVPASVTIPAGSYYAYFEVAAQDTVGTIQIQATALGYNAAAANVQVTAPRFTVSTSAQLNTTSAPATITVYATDANGTAHYTTEAVTVTLVASAPSVAQIDSLTVTIPAGQYYTQAARWAPGQVGTSVITASDQRAAYYKYGDGTDNVAVVTPSLNLTSMPSVLGIGQYVDYAYVSLANNAAAPIAVAFTRPGAARTATYDNLTTTPNSGVTIPAGTYYQYFRVAGTTAGTDTLIASAASPAHNPDTAFTVVGTGRIDPIGNWPASLVVGDSVAITLYTRAPNQTQRSVLAATTFTLVPSANLEFRSGGAVITQVTVPAGASSVTFYIKALASGAGSANITGTNYTAYSNTVTVP